MEFISDLSDYEQYMNPETEEYLFLVNADHPLTAGDVPDDLTDVVNTRKDGRDTQKLREYAEKALEALFARAARQEQCRKKERCKESHLKILKMEVSVLPIPVASAFCRV